MSPKVRSRSPAGEYRAVTALEIPEVVELPTATKLAFWSATAVNPSDGRPDSMRVPPFANVVSS
jgi:hypothetical protein